LAPETSETVTIASSEPTDAAPGPLIGVRVLELGDALGLYAGKLLADLGADVLLIEPPGGIGSRHLPPFYHDTPSSSTSLAFWYLCTSKRSVTCDVTTADGRALFDRLVATAQVVLTGGQPGWLETLGCGFARYARLHPALIWASITGFGEWGPHAGWLAPDLVGVAMSGIMTLAGYPDRAPVQPPGRQGMISASIQAAQGVLMALRVAERTGCGQQIEVSMQEALSLAQETAMQTWDMRHELRKRQGDASLLPGVGTYACADGYVYSMVGIPGFGAPWSVLAGWMDSEGMAEDLAEDRWQKLLGNINLREVTRLWSDPEKLAEVQKQFRHVDEVLGCFYARYSKQYLYEEGQGRRLLIGPVNTVRDLFENKQLNARDWYRPVEHPELGETFSYPGPPFRMSASPWRISRRAPLVGEHNVEVWGQELGYRRDQIEALMGAGVL